MVPSPEPEAFVSESNNIFVSIHVENKVPDDIVLESSLSLLEDEEPKKQLLHENYQLLGQQQMSIKDIPGPPSFVCEWMTTNIRLPTSSSNSCLHGGIRNTNTPAPTTLSNSNKFEESPKEDCYLCLPVRCSSPHVSIQNEEKEDSRDDEQSISAATKLRLMALDQYLASAAPLAASTQKLLFNGRSGAKTRNNPGTSDSRSCMHTESPMNALSHHPHRRSQFHRHKPHHCHPHSHHHLVTSTNSGRVLNVLQGEIAHCTPHQADVIVSDDATTCHVVSLWSRYICKDKNHSYQQGYNAGNEEECSKNTKKRGGAGGDGAESLLASLTHIDGTGYRSCLREAVMEHFEYHSRHFTESHSGKSLSVNGDFNNEEKEERKDGTASQSNCMNDCKKSDTFNNNDGSNNPIEMSIHIMGGFNDNDKSSIAITDDVLQTLSELSKEFDAYSLCNQYNNLCNATRFNDGGPTKINMTLETCAVSSANDDGNGFPIGRGLAMEVATGRVFLAEVEESHAYGIASPHSSRFVSPYSPKTEIPTMAFSSRIGAGIVEDSAVHTEGPEVILRSIRLWAAAFHPSSERQERKLSVIHGPTEEYLCIQPFVFGPNPYARELLRLNDAKLLRYTSTSPEVEKPNFASKVRHALTHMIGMDSSRVFVRMEGEYQPMKYRRIGLNGWTICK